MPSRRLMPVSRLLAVGILMAGVALTGCGEQEPPRRGSNGTNGPVGPQPPTDEPPAEESMPSAGRYETHTPAALAAAVRQAVKGRDFLGLIRLTEPEARFEFTKNSKDWFFAAVKIRPSAEQALLAEQGLTRGQFDLMDEEHYTAYTMWRGEKHQDLIAQLSGHLMSVYDRPEGGSATFLYDVSGTPRLATFELVRTDRGWRIVVPGAIKPVPRPATEPTSQPATAPTTRPATAPAER